MKKLILFSNVFIIHFDKLKRRVYSIFMLPWNLALDSRDHGVPSTLQSSRCKRLWCHRLLLIHVPSQSAIRTGYLLQWLNSTNSLVNISWCNSTAFFGNPGLVSTRTKGEICLLACERSTPSMYPIVPWDFLLTTPCPQMYTKEGWILDRYRKDTKHRIYILVKRTSNGTSKDSFSVIIKIKKAGSRRSSVYSNLSYWERFQSPLLGKTQLDHRRKRQSCRRVIPGTLLWI